MSEFLARIGEASGQVVERPFSADNEESLRRELDQKGYYVFSVTRRGGVGSVLDVFRPQSRVPNREFMIFNHELATLLKAGLPLLQGLDILLERMSNELFREILRDIRDQVKGGTALSEAFAAYPQYFPPLYSASLKAGERSGELEEVIRRFITYTKVMDEVRKKVRQALIYPSFLMGTSLGVVYILLTYAMPKFADLYASFGSNLPLLTNVMIQLSSFLRGNLVLSVVMVASAFVAFTVAWNSKKGRLFIDFWKMRLPFIGTIWQKFAVSQLTRALETLLQGGIPLVSAIDTAAGSVGNRTVSTRVRGVVQNIREGESLSAALERTEILQPMVIEMVKVGESTGALAEMLGNVANYYDEDISEDLARFLTYLEPALLLGMGGIIAAMLLSMYYPIFGLQSVIE